MNRSSALRGFVSGLDTRRAFVCAWAFVLGVTVAAADSARASTDTQDCLGAIFSAAGKFAQCRYKAEAKYFASLDPLRQAADRAKCSAKLDSSVAKAYGKYGNACPDPSSTTETSDMVEDGITSAMGWTAWQLVSGVSDPQTIYQPDAPSTWPLGSHDDTPRIIVSPASNVVTTESGGTARFAVALSTPPTASVTIALTSSDTAEAVVSTPMLTFTSDNWNTEQVFDIAGVTDLANDGDSLVHINLDVALFSEAEEYGLAVSQDVSVVVEDEPRPRIMVRPQHFPLITTEAGGTATFTVVLDFAPTASVTIPIVSSPPSSRSPGVIEPLEGTVSSSSLTFNPSGPSLWNTPQTVTVTGVNDSVADGDRPYKVLLGSVVSADPGYAGLDPEDVGITNGDDDRAGVIVVPQSGLLTTESGGTATFTVVLNSEPVDPVTIGISSSDPGEATASPSFLTFAPANSHVAQTVTVTGIDDLVQDGNQILTIVTAPATSNDPAYAGFDAADVVVLNMGTTTTTSTTSTTLPSGCGVSDKCIFVTSTTATGSLGGLAGADAACNARASAAGLPGTYVAWLSDGTASAVDRATSNGPYVTPAGDLVANSEADLTDGSLGSPIDDDENGTSLSGVVYVWTGSHSDGTTSTFGHCSAWTTISGNAVVGLATATNSDWSTVYQLFCDYNDVHLYCVQQ